MTKESFNQFPIFVALYIRFSGCDYNRNIATDEIQRLLK